MTKKRIAITGAAGNLGSLLSLGLVSLDIDLNLLIHKKQLCDELRDAKNSNVFAIDLANKKNLKEALTDVDVVVHFAGVLFKANPEKFLTETNTAYFKNLLDVATEQNVKRIILISFPHVEGESHPNNPTKGSLDGKPISMHAKTRLEEERLLFSYTQEHKFEAVSLRVGMVYGKGILMIDAAQWFAKHYLLGVWNKPTYIHLISKTDFVNITTVAILKEKINGIYHIGDSGVQTLQEFLDDITRYKSYKKPWRMPVWMIMAAASCFEFISKIFNTQSPLTKDFIRIGMVSYYGDTIRMREELSPKLEYENYKDAMHLFD